MTGFMLAEEMLKVRPDIPIILFSGHHDMIDEKTATQIGIKALMMKPIKPREMARSIGEVLGKPVTAPRSVKFLFRKRCSSLFESFSDSGPGSGRTFLRWWHASFHSALHDHFRITDTKIALDQQVMGFFAKRVCKLAFRIGLFFQ